MRVDQACRESNWALMGLLVGSAETSPADMRSRSMRGMIANCEIAVSASMRTMRMWLAEKTQNLPRTTRLQITEQPRKIIPAAKPIQCRSIRVLRTTRPARWVEGNTVNDVCATTGKKIRAPSQMVKHSSRTKRRKVIRRIYFVSCRVGPLVRPEISLSN